MRGRDLGSFVADAQQAVDARGRAAARLTVDWGGQFENLQAASARLALLVPLALAPDLRAALHDLQLGAPGGC